ncbi:methyltransferase [Bacillus sp. S70]|uniref:methyltransferase n=1 Tax=unclassified Bacillus (in: firmicutes) TaxID=185979 RepID=UPI00190C3907|nr:methyltransferase [Bacillus sp. S29]MBK0101784.1 methyltransferase [Bacillus sp. S70]MBK0107138.1 methyltransferase [Bacillus sp. S73]MBK0136048.1 methyltransferase [Bacillus sp. S72]MBK0147403.1 methyltransferase [Bacillus sp. S74]MBK0159098.1 methyltransferase [Bacillus sp. S71]
MISGEIGVKDVIGGSVADERAKQKRYTEVMKKFNEMIANDPHLQSVLVPIGDRMMISKVKK